MFQTNSGSQWCTLAFNLCLISLSKEWFSINERTALVYIIFIAESWPVRFVSLFFSKTLSSISTLALTTSSVWFCPCILADYHRNYNFSWSFFQIPRIKTIALLLPSLYQDCFYSILIKNSCIVSQNKTKQSIPKLQLLLQPLFLFLCLLVIFICISVMYGFTV